MKRLTLEITKNGIRNMFILAMLLMAACTSEGQTTRDTEAKAPSTTIHEAAFMGNTSEIQLHVDAGTDLNEKDQYGSSPLAIAATFNKPEVARLLIEGGADINTRAGDGSTPLHTAAFFCRKEIVEMLLDNGADVSIRNNYGSTALESITTSFQDVKPIYDQLSKDLGPFGFKLDYDYIKETRPVIAEMIKKAN